MSLKISAPLARPSMIMAWLFLILGVIFFYDILFDMVLSLIHSLFEFIEHALDSLVEHVFHTSPHTTEVIVFYILVSALGFALYKLVRAIPHGFERLKVELIGFYLSEKTTVLNFWQSRSNIDKSKYSTRCLLGVALFILWLFS